MESDTPSEPPVTNVSLESWSTEDANERVRVVFDLSLNEYVALASCVDVGRDIAYGDNSIYLWWIWVRSLLSMDICGDVATCISDSPAVRTALTSWYRDQQQADAQAAMDKLRADDMASGNGSTCDEDAWWSGILSLVQRLNRGNEDSLEIFEASTNSLDFAANVIGDITGIDESSLDAILSWAAFLQENIAENYVAQYTLAYEEEIACDLFCIALENCSLSAEQIFDYFWTRVSSSITWDSLLTNALGYLVGRAWSGTEIADFMMLSQIGFRRFLGQFTGNRTAFNDLSNSLRMGFNSPDSDWSIICPVCDTVICFDMSDFTTLTIDQGIIDVNFGNPEPAVKMANGDVTGFPINAPSNLTTTKVVVLEYPLPSGVTVKNIKFDYYSDMIITGASPGLVGTGMGVFEADDTELFKWTGGSPINFETWSERTQNPDVVVGVGARVFVWLAITTDFYESGDAWIDNLCIRYA